MASSGGRPARRWLAVLGAGLAGLIVAGVALGAFAYRFEHSSRHIFGDTWFYSWQAARFAGVPDAEARQQASQLVCSDIHGGLSFDGTLVPICDNYRAYGNPRYVAIFTSRPLYPLLMAPFVHAFGLARGMLWGSVAGAVLAALAVFLALRALGLSTVAATAAGVAFSLLPTGFEADKALAEGVVLAALAAGLHGAAQLVRGHWWGLAWLLPTAAALYAFKPANGGAFAVAMLAAGLVLLPLWRRGVPQALTLAAVGAAGIGGWLVVSRWLGLPSLADTMQDLATRHFKLPDVPDPVHVLTDVNHQLWGDQVQRWLGLPYPFAIVLPALVIVVVGLRRAGVVWAMVSLSAIGIVVAHPMISQYDRLLVSIWLVVAAAVAVVVDAVGAGLRRLFTRRPAAEPAPSGAAPAEAVPVPAA